MLDINGPAHIFYEAKDYGADVNLIFISLNDQHQIQSSAGLYFAKLSNFQELDLTTEDFIFIPGIAYELLSDVNFIKEITPFFTWLRKQYNQGVSICSVCTGTFLLAESRLLDNRKCTTHWKYLTEFKHKFQNVELINNRLFVVDGRLFSSAGVSSGIDLSLYIIERLYGPKFATDIAKEVVVYFRRSESDPQLSVFLQYRNHLDTRVHDVQDYLTKNLHTTFTLDDIADELYMSSRNLTRLFKKTTGITIGNYVEKLRVDKAFHLLSEGHKVNYVAHLCGLKSTNQLRTLLKKYHGVLPKKISSL